MLIFPSLAALGRVDLQALAGAVVALEPFVDGFHIDSMDGRFVSTLWGEPALVEQIRQMTDLPFWYHLMAYEYDLLLDRLPLQQDDWVSVQYEAIVPLSQGITDHSPLGQYASMSFDSQSQDSLSHGSAVALHRYLMGCETLQARGIAMGIALAHGTPLLSVEPLMAQIDHLLVMGVPIGSSGQSMIPDTPERVAEAYRAAQRLNEQCHILLDGGVTGATLSALHRPMPYAAAIGAAIFHTGLPYEHAVATIRKTLEVSE